MTSKALRKISLTLAAILAAGQVTACGSTSTPDNAGNNDTTASVETTSAEPVETGRADIKDNLPEKDLGGATYTILARTGFEYEIDAESENGDTLNDAVYKRNTTIEDRFNVKIAPVYQAQDNFNQHLRSSVLSASGAYDLVAGYAYQVTPMILDDIFLNWYDVKYIDISQPWWSKQVADELTVNNICYTLSGDLTVSLWQYFLVFLFNKRLAEEHQIGDVYEIVRNGEWTLEKLSELTQNTYRDLDGNTTQTMTDSFGMIASNTTPVDAFMDAFQIKVTTKNSQGVPEFSINTEKTVDVLTRLVKFAYTEGNTAINNQHNDVKLTFREGRALFYATPMSNVVGFRDMEDDFGILPYPKFDASQENYYSTSMDNFSFLLMPIDVKNVDNAGLITEALAAESYRSVVPAFYDKVLKTKVSRDDDSAEMLDIVRDNLIFNFGYSFSNVLGMPGHVFQEAFKAENSSVSTSWEMSQESFQTKLDELLTHYGVK